MPEDQQKEKGKTAAKRKEIVPAKSPQRPSSVIEPYRPLETWRNFDRVFERFRRDFENELWPSTHIYSPEFPAIREFEARFPSIDLEDKGNEYVLTAEVPGFGKEDIEIQVEEDTVEIRGAASHRRDEKTRGYVRKERSSESFYRRIKLPEEVKTDASQANLKDGVLELILSKKKAKARKKISIK